VAEQTAEIRQAYEAEKKARQDLEKLNDAKNQFITLTQHHLRAPATDITYGLDSILAGTYGVVASGLRTAVKGMRTSAERLTRLVNDFLNITTLKAGRGILDISSTSLKPAIVDILEELRGDIEKMHIKVSYPRDDASWPPLSIDFAKMREILFIVIDNAVRYNHEGGSVSISTKVDGNNFELVIENTGIGISPEEKEKIGCSLFYRGKYARSAYPTGMGVGLSLVKNIVAAHHGSFAIESEGQEKGARVRIRLPLK
jgi:signal transduction histidine kinase